MNERRDLKAGTTHFLDNIPGAPYHRYVWALVGDSKHFAQAFRQTANSVVLDQLLLYSLVEECSQIFSS